jgi:sec-independent protein translocase protein TatC
LSAYLNDESEIEASRAPLLDHLVELRQRLIICAWAVMAAFVGCFFISQDIYLFLVRPFEVASAFSSAKAQPGPIDLILGIAGLTPLHVTHPALLQATGPLEIFFAKMKLALFAAIVISFPILAWQLYRFVAPGLYKRERKAFLPFLFASPILFMLGAALVYYVMLPFVMWFSLSQQVETAGVHIALIPKVSDYLDLVTKLILAFGLCFQLPVVVSLAGLAGLVRAEQLTSSRRYAIVGIFALAAVVTPPDMISPFFLAVPIYLLFEASIICVKLIERAQDREDAAAA